MRNAKCEMRNAKCETRNAKCETNQLIVSKITKPVPLDRLPLIMICYFYRPVGRNASLISTPPTNMDKDHILEAAARIFSHKGYHAASMQDIANAVNLQKPSLYHHVASKQEILRALLDKALDVLIERLDEVVARPLPPEEKLRLAITAYMQTLADNRELASVLLLEYRSLSPDELARHVPRRDRFERIWRDLIQDGIRNGHFASVCHDAALAARALLGVMNWSIFWYRPDGALSMAAIANDFAELFLSGLLIRESHNG